MCPARTPGGIDLGEMVERRLAQIGPEDLRFTAPTAGLLRRSNWGRYVWDRAAEDQPGGIVPYTDVCPFAVDLRPDAELEASALGPGGEPAVGVVGSPDQDGTR
jgi:hypothetical protein